MTGTYDGLVFTEGQSDEFTLMHDEAVKTDPAYVDLSAGEATFTVAVPVGAGKGVTISGIPADVAYAVEEQGYTDFDKTCAGEAGTIDPAATAAPTALVTNTRQLGSLTVGKTVVSSNPEDKQGDKAKAFTFTVTLTGMDIDDGKYGDMTFEGNVATVTLKHGETATAAGLPAGIEYAVAEAPVKGFTNTVFDNESGVIPVKDTAEAKFTNTRDEGDLVVGKRVVSDLTADRDVAFTFTVELADETIHGPYGEMTFEDGVTTFTLKKGEPIQYTIQVQPVDGYDVDVNGTDVTASLIHRDPEAWMQMSGTKTWDDGNDARGLRPEEITLRLLRDGELFESQTVSEAEGWSYSFGELPADDGYGHVYGYELREDGVVGYFARVDGMNVTNSLQPRNTLPLANDGADPTAPEGAAPVEPLGVGYEEDRNTGTPLPKFGGYTEAELEEQYSMFGYDTPKAGMLNTGDETPAWPWAFGGAGALALIALALLGRKKKRA